MKHGMLAAVLVLALVAPVSPVGAQGRAATTLGSVTLTHKVTADGQPLAGTAGAGGQR